MANRAQAGIDAANLSQILDAAQAFREQLPNSKIEKSYWYHSPKARSFITVRGDVAFFHTILDEFDPAIAWFAVEEPSAIETADGEPAKSRFDARLRLRGGGEVWREYKRSEQLKSQSERVRLQLEVQRKAAEVAGAKYEIRTEKGLPQRSVRFWNCLALLGWVNRARGVTDEQSTRSFVNFFSLRTCASLEDILAIPNADPALSLRAVGQYVADGLLKIDFDRPLTRLTVFTKCDGAEFRYDSTSDIEGLSQTEEQLLPPPGLFPDIPEHLLDMRRWRKANAAFMKDPETFEQRHNALLMLWAGESFSKIEVATRFAEAEVRRLVAMCARARRDGDPVGFPALNKWGYDRRYHRRQEAPPLDNRSDRTTAGWSGLLTALFDRFPDVLEVVIDGVLEYASNERVPLRKPSWTTVHSAFMEALRKEVSKGKLQKTDYPFNVATEGKVSLRRFCKDLKKGHASRWILARDGADAKTKAGLGIGKSGLIVPIAPLQAAELDFYKTDGLTSLRLDTPLGEISAVIPRWWTGVCACAESGAFLGEALSFEKQTVAEDVLEVAEAMLIPPPADAELARAYSVASDGLWLANQSVPEIAYHGIDLLKLDRAWANSAKLPLAKLAQALGCVICIGSSRSWFQRAQIERQIKEIAKQVQASASSVGSGPTDPRREAASGNALKYEVKVSSLRGLIRASIRAQAEYRGESSFYIGRRSRLSQAVSNPASNWVPRPIPLSRREDNPLSWVDHAVVISGGGGKVSRAPFVRKHGIRFQGEELAQAWGCIGRKAILQVRRRDITTARVFEVGSGRSFGRVVPESRWRHVGLTWRTVRQIIWYGGGVRGLRGTSEPVLDYSRDLKKKLRNRPKRDKNKTAAAALQLSQLDASGAELVPGSSMDDMPSRPSSAGAKQPWSTDESIPSAGSFTRR